MHKKSGTDVTSYPTGSELGKYDASSLRHFFFIGLSPISFVATLFGLLELLELPQDSGVYLTLLCFQANSVLPWMKL